MADEIVLEMEGVRKEFPGVLANDDVDLDVRRGEVHALLGENGAGKSTLMNILYGLYHPDAGEIRLHGKPVAFASARDAIGRGNRDGAPALHAHPGDDRGREHRPRHRARQGRRPARRAGGGSARARALGAVRPARRPCVPRQRHHRRAAAARRDPEGALPRRRRAHPRRADRGADAAGGARALRHHQKPEGGREVDHLHHPQAERGARDRRPDHRAPPRKKGRDRPAGGSDGGVARPRDGRARGPAPRREDARAAGRRPARGRGHPRPRRPGHREGARDLVRGARRRDRRASRASTATARRS